MVAVNLTALVDEIRTRRLSRNRNFHLMSRAPYRAAMRLMRYLDRLAEDLRRCGAEQGAQLTVRRDPPDRVELRIVDPPIQAERHCYLSEDELRCLLRHHPDVRPIIEQGESSNA